MWSRGVVSLAILSLATCADEPPAARQLTPVGWPRLPWSAEDTIRVLGRPGDSSGWFYRLAGATRLQDGSIAVAEVEGRVQVFDAQGSPVAAISRPGQGPGEFEHIDGIWQGPADTIWIGEAARGRIVAFSPAGELLSTVRLPTELVGMLSTVIGFTEEAEPIVQRLRPDPQTANGPRRLGPMPPSFNEWYRLDRETLTTTKLAEAEAAEMYAHKWGAALVRGSIIFGAQSFAWPSGSGIAVARPIEDLQVEEFDGDGRQVRTLGHQFAPRAVTEADREQYVEWRLRMAPGNVDLPGWRRAFADSPKRDRFPAMAGGLVDAVGATWVRQYAPPYAEVSEWSVFDSDGTWLGVVELPGPTQVTEIGRDYVLGIARDELKVETVVLLRLER